MHPPDKPPVETVDSLFEGALVLGQHARGYRFSIDAVLLAGAVRVGRRARVLDLGCGNGVVGLAIAHLLAPAEVVAVEVQAPLAELARRNAERNGLERVTVLTGDVRQIRELVAAAGFEAVVCNPPYHSPDSGRVNPDEERAAARHEIYGDLGDFLAAAGFAVAPRGLVYVVYPATRLQYLLETMGGAGLGLVWLQLVHPRPAEAATLVLACARRGRRGPAQLRPPLCIHENGRHSPVVAALLAGDRPRYPGEPAPSRRGPGRSGAEVA